MPRLPKSKEMPWLPKIKKHLRQVDNASFYNSKRWRSLRAYYIQSHPLCAECNRNGITTGAKVVDHIKPITMGGSPIDIRNLQILCEPCHNSKSGREGVAYRKSLKIRSAIKNKKNKK